MKFKALKITEEGHCEKCGRACPRRRVLIQPIDVDGNPSGEPQAWGVNCAAEARHGSKSRSAQSQIVAEAEREQLVAALNERQKLARVAIEGCGYSIGGGTPFICGGDDRNNSPENVANRLYHRTRRPIAGSYFARSEKGSVVRVDGRDPVDVEFFASRGFVQATEPVEEVLQ